MPTTIITPSQDAIVSEIEIAAPAERVFKALSDAGELQRWFRSPECPTKFWKMDARVGGHYLYPTPKRSIVVNENIYLGWEGEILECHPPRLLVYTWIANWHDDPKSRTVVRWEL